MTALSDDRLKDLFFRQSKEYAQYRPTYPDELFKYLATLSPQTNTAWDCATGNGQAAIKLGNHFSKVIATDINENQLKSAPAHPHVEYRMASAEKSGLEDHSVDLVTVAQAVHWFKFPQFYEEVKRVLRPGGVIAVWCYGVAQITPEVERVFDSYYKDHLGPYWEKEREYVDVGYRTIPFPFKEIIPPEFEIRVRWTLEHFLGYLISWSSSQMFLKKTGQSPLEAGDFQKQFEKAWPANQSLDICWKLAFRIGRV